MLSLMELNNDRHLLLAFQLQLKLHEEIKRKM